MTRPENRAATPAEPCGEMAESCIGQVGGGLESATLLVHIAFHFVGSRVEYLRKVLLALCEYRLRSVEIVVDSNDEATLDALDGISLGPGVSLSVRLHRDLEHPFLLTWQHRSAFAERQQEFDYYLYLEDDILVPWSTFEPWARELPILDRHGWLRGVLRVEPDAHGILMASDWYRPVHQPVEYQIDGAQYIRPEEPYQACWCCTREQLQRFARSKAWFLGAHRWSHVRARIPKFSGDWFIRERASLGPIFSPAGTHRMLLPVDSNRAISSNAFVHHLPANYALNAKSRYAKIPVKQLIVGTMVRAGSIRSIAADLQREVLHWAMWLTGPHPVLSLRGWLRRTVRGRR